MMTERLFRQTRAVTLSSPRKIASSRAKSSYGSSRLVLRNLPSNDNQPSGRRVKSFEWPTEGGDDDASCPSNFSITSLSPTPPSRRGGQRSPPSSRAARGPLQRPRRSRQ